MIDAEDRDRRNEWDILINVENYLENLIKSNVKYSIAKNYFIFYKILFCAIFI